MLFWWVHFIYQCNILPRYLNADCSQAVVYFLHHCPMLLMCLLSSFNRQTATSVQRCRCLTEHPGWTNATDQNESKDQTVVDPRLYVYWILSLQTFSQSSFIPPIVPLCLSVSLKSSSSLHSASSLTFLAPAWMQEWEVLLGDRLALSFQEAECRPRLSGCKNKKNEGKKTALEGKGRESFMSAMGTTLV